MTTNPRPCVAGDIGDTRNVTLGGVQTLVGATAVAHVRYLADPTVIADLAATITSTTDRTVTVNLGTSGGWLPSRPASGDWDIEVEVTFGDGSVLTFPDGDPDTLTVRDDLD